MPETPVTTKPAPKQKPRTDKQKNKPKPLPPFNVVLLDDDDHTYEYVIEMLQKVFGHGLEKSFLMAKEVDTQGRVIVYTTHKELAELKRDQIRGYGRDARIAASAGSMTAIVEPAMG